jgi:hypothetical protein
MDVLRLIAYPRSLADVPSVDPQPMGYNRFTLKVLDFHTAYHIRRKVHSRSIRRTGISQTVLR